MPFLGRHFIFLPGALPLIMAVPRPSQDHYRPLWAGPEGCGACTARHCDCGCCAGRHTPPAARQNSLHGPGRHAEGRTWASAAWLPAPEARGRRREKALGRAPRSWLPRAWAVDPRPSPSAPSRPGRRQSSRPPPPPPETPGSWQRRGQRRKGELRRPPPCEPCKPPNARRLQPHHPLRNKPATGSFLAVAPFPSGLFRSNTDGRMRAGTKTWGFIFVGHLGAVVPVSVGLLPQAL